MDKEINVYIKQIRVQLCFNTMWIHLNSDSLALEVFWLYYEANNDCLARQKKKERNSIF